MEIVAPVIIGTWTAPVIPFPKQLLLFFRRLRCVLSKRIDKGGCIRTP